MKVLSMIQPWATLLVQGETLYETRSGRPGIAVRWPFMQARKSIS